MPFNVEIAGLAIQITPDNLQHLAVVNKGVAPAYEGFYTGSYFIMPADPNLPNRIVPGYVFELNWAAWNPADYPLNPNFFVEIAEI